MKFLMGLIIGVALAVGVVLYIQNKNTIGQFMPNQSTSTKDDKHDSSSPLILAPGLKKMQQASEVTAQSVNNSTESEQIKSYDFYDVLEGKKSLNESTVTTNSTNTQKKVDAKPSIYVQIGAYSNPDEANNMKARLILMDIDAKIVSANVNGQLLNKVIVGPFQNASDARQAQSAIQQQGISAIITNISN